MSALGAGVSLSGIFMEAWQIVFNLKTGIVAADIGKAVTLDTTADNTVKLATDTDPILGRLETVEDRTVEGILVGTVSLKGALKFPKAAGDTVDVGDMVQGSSTADGNVKVLVPPTDLATSLTHAIHHKPNIVVEVPTTTSAIVIIF